MNETLQAQIDAYLGQLDGLIRRGRELQGLLVTDPTDAFAITTTRVWQQDCGVIVNQLSGGSKSHWLARSFSEAFLMRSESGGAVEGASPEEIVARLLGVLEQAVASLLRTDEVSIVTASSGSPSHRRFEFVHNSELRPVLEQAYGDSRRAFEHEHYDQSLQISCGILESIVTDALEHKGLNALAASGAPPGKIADWSFQTRIAVAERAGLIRNGCARLPAVAWTYRNHGETDLAATVTEREARLVGQVLRVLMRDLDPGR
jgi:hypothetical protein